VATQDKKMLAFKGNECIRPKTAIDGKPTEEVNSFSLGFWLKWS
jgi:hypothetical protein